MYENQIDGFVIERRGKDGSGSEEFVKGLSNADLPLYTPLLCEAKVFESGREVLNFFGACISVVEINDHKVHPIKVDYRTQGWA
jgi:hypothetical protein